MKKKKKARVRGGLREGERDIEKPILFYIMIVEEEEESAEAMEVRV